MSWRGRGRWQVLGAFAIVLVLAPVVTADPLEDTLRGLAEKFAANPLLKGKKVGIVDFPSEQGTKLTELGVYVSEKLYVELSKLAAANGFEIVEREGLDQVKQEYRLWTSDHVTASQAQHLGNLAGLDVMILGSLNDLEERIHLIVKAIESKTAKNLGADDATIPKDGAIKKRFGRTVAARAPQSFSAASLPAAAPDPNRLIAELWTEKSSYKLGDKIRFQFRTNRDAYVTLINVSTSGGMSIIFPNQFSKNNFVKAGQTISVPGEGWGFDFVLSGQPGTEIVRLVASEDPVQWTLGNLPPGGPIQEITKKEVIVQANVDLAAVRAKANPSRWAEAVLHVDVSR